MTDYFYKGLSIALLAILLIVTAGMGYEWNLAAHDRNQAQAELKAEKDASEQLRISIREQNRAVEALAQAKAQAEARSMQAQQLATANGRYLDAALAQVKNAKAVTCADAMPYVNQILKGIR